MTSGSRPDITPAQIVAFVSGLLAFLAAHGLNISASLSAQIIDLARIWVPALLASDAAIRGGRNYAEGKRLALLATQSGGLVTDRGDAGSRPDPSLSPRPQ